MTMKTCLASLLLLAFVTLSTAQADDLTITNTVKVALSTNSDNALRLAWKLDSNSRTNGLPPYDSVTNALTYGQYQDWLATDAFVRIAQVKAAENESRVMLLYRNATDADRAKVARILAGLGN